MQFLGFPPRTAVAVFTEVLDHETHILEIPHTRVRVPEPKTLRVLPDQFAGALHQFRRRRRRRRQFVQFIRCSTHAENLRSAGTQSKPGIVNCYKWS